MNNNRRRNLLLIMLFPVLTLGGCGNSDDQPDPAIPGADTSKQVAKPAPVVLPTNMEIAPGTVKKICATWGKEQRVQYQLAAPVKVTFGVSFGQELAQTSPVPARSVNREVRAFVVRRDGEHCFHIENGEAEVIAITFSYKVL